MTTEAHLPSHTNEEHVRVVVLRHLEQRLLARGLSPTSLHDQCDLLQDGIIDSLGLIELISAVEQDLRVKVDFETMDSAELTLFGPFCRFVAAHCISAETE